MKYYIWSITNPTLLLPIFLFVITAFISTQLMLNVFVITIFLGINLLYKRFLITIIKIRIYARGIRTQRNIMLLRFSETGKN